MRISPKQLAQTLYDLTDEKSKPEAEKSVADFARYIYKNRKLKLAEKIIERFADIYNKEKGIVEADVTSRKKLDEALVRRVKHYIREKYQVKEVIIKNLIDESVKGGVVIRVGDEIIDESVAGKLDELKKVLVS